jgi:hypothetical protein
VLGRAGRGPDRVHDVGEVLAQEGNVEEQEVVVEELEHEVLHHEGVRVLRVRAWGW